MSADLFHVAYLIEGQWYEAESPMTKAAAEEMFWATEWKIVSEAKAGASITRPAYQASAPQWDSQEFQNLPDDFFDAAPADDAVDPSWQVIRDDVEVWPDRQAPAAKAKKTEVRRGRR